MKKLLILFCLLAITLGSDDRDGGLLNRVGKMFDYLKNQPIVPKVQSDMKKIHSYNQAVLYWLAGLPKWLILNVADKIESKLYFKI